MPENQNSLDWLRTRIVRIILRETNELIGSGSIVGMPPRVLTVAHLFEEHISKYVVLDVEDRRHGITDIKAISSLDLAILNCSSLAGESGSISISKRPPDLGDNVLMGGFTNSGVKRGMNFSRRQVTSHGVIERPSGDELVVWGVPYAAAYSAMSGGPVVLDSSLMQVGVIYGFESEPTGVVTGAKNIELELKQRTRDLFVDFAEIDEHLDVSSFGGLFLRSLPVCTDKVLESFHLLGLQAQVISQSEELGDVIVASFERGFIQFSVGALVMPSGVRITKGTFESAFTRAENAWSECGLAIGQRVVVLSDDSIADTATWQATAGTNFVHENELIEELVDATAYLHTKSTSLQQELPSSPLNLHAASQNSPSLRGPVLDAVTQWVKNDTQSKSFFLLGGYGSGKTTTLKTLFVKLCQEYLDGKSERVPIYVSLADAQESTLTAVFSDVWSDIAPAQADRSKLYEHLAENDRVVLLLDGFDELVDSRFNKISRRDIKQLASLLKNGSKSILTSRLESWELPVIQSAFAELVEASGSEEFELYSLVPLTTEEIANRLSDISSQILERVRENGSLLELCRTPFFLDQLGETIGGLAIDREVSLGRILTQSMALKVSRDIQRSLTNPYITTDDAFAVLESLAEAVCRNGNRELSRADLDRLVEDHFGGSGGLAALHLFDILHTGFLEFRKHSRAFAFKHQIFLDYFQSRVCSKYLEGDVGYDVPHAFRARLTREGTILLKDLGATQDKLFEVVQRSRGQEFDNIGESASNAVNCLRLLTASLRGVDFSSCLFVGADFGSLDLKRSNFSAATIVDCTFEGANLDSVSMRDADLRSSDLKSGRSIYGLDYSHDDQTVIVGSSNHLVETLDLRRGDFIVGRKLVEHLDLVCCLKASPNGEFVASGGQDLVVNIVKLDDGSLYRTLRGHLGDVREVIWLDNERLVSVGRDNRAVLWSISEEKLLRLVELGSEGWTGAFDSAEGRLFVGLDDGRLTILNTEDFSILGSYQVSNERICAMEYLAHQQCIFLASNDGAIHVVSQNGELLKKIILDGSPVKAICFSEDQSSLFAGTELGVLHRVDIEDGSSKVLKKIHADAFGGIVPFDAEHVLSCGHDGRVCLVQVEEGVILAETALFFSSAEFSCSGLDLRGAKGLSSARLQHLAAMGATVAEE